MSIRIADLHEAYGSASKEDRIAMANLGAVCWGAVKDALYGQWQTAMTAEESEKAEKWREEGRKELGQLLKAKGGEVAALSAQLAAAEAAVEGLRGSITAEAAKHAEALVESARKDFELSNAKEMLDITARLSAAEVKEETYKMLKENYALMRENMDTLQKELIKYQEASATKSSHAIGKAGELTIHEILETRVAPWFASASVENMAGVSHSADFHLTVQSPHGKSVKILIDVKKYKDSVRLKEIQKLHKDIDSDTTAVGGMLISLDSGIMGKAHFQIEKTPQRKTCINLVLKDYNDNTRGDVITWAARVLSTLHPDGRITEDNRLYDEVVSFVGEINTSIRDAETGVRACMKALEGAKIVRDGLVRRVAGFRMRVFEEVEDCEESIEHVLETPKVLIPDAVRCKKIKADGDRCRNRRGGDEYCKSHQK